MTTTTTEAFEALMPEPTMRLNYAGHFMHRKGPLNIGERGLYTDDQVRTTMQAVWDAATERAAKQERELEQAFLWCLRNLTQYAHHEIRSDSSNGVMRAWEAIRSQKGSA